MSRLVRLGKTVIRTLDGSTREECVSVERETDLAILLRFERRGKVRQMWLPRSQIRLDERMVVIPDWLWAAKGDAI